MVLSEKEIIRIAELARIELSEEERNRFEGELDMILDYVRQLDEVDTAGLSPMTGGTREENVTRTDEPLSDILEGAGADLVRATPEKKNGYVSVPSIFE